MMRAMNISGSAVHPVESVPQTEAAPRAMMKHVQGMPGTGGGLGLRLCQLAFAAISLSVMLPTSDFPSVSAFCFLVAAVGLQSLWSLLLAVIDAYALLVRRSFQSYGIVSLFTFGDGVTSTLTFSAACASAGITVFIGDGINTCAVNHCARFESATAMAFLCWFVAAPSFFFNFWSLASR